jgi:hypothetical protein
MTTTPTNPDTPTATTRLICHPATPAPAVRSVEATIRANPDGSIALFYCLRGDIVRLRIPEDCAPERMDQLWEHTCFEAFIAVCGESAYREFNFSPSGQWAAYAFKDYRQAMNELPAIAPPSIATRRFAGRIEVDVVLPAQSLPSGRRPWQIGISAVIEEADTVDGSHSYWALRHPSPRPDFHHRDAFMLDWPKKA